MRAIGVGILAVASILTAACDQQAVEVGSQAPTLTPGPTVASPTTESPEPTAATPVSGEPDPQGDEASYVVFPEIEAVEVATACEAEGPHGPIYRADLENGGTLQLRKLPEGILHASAIPAPGADPVGTNVPSDSSFTEDGGWINGTSVMWLAGTENNITVEYHVRWDETIPGCAS